MARKSRAWEHHLCAGWKETGYPESLVSCEKTENLGANCHHHRITVRLLKVLQHPSTFALPFLLSLLPVSQARRGWGAGVPGVPRAPALPRPAPRAAALQAAPLAVCASPRNAARFANPLTPPQSLSKAYPLSLTNYRSGQHHALYVKSKTAGCVSSELCTLSCLPCRQGFVI